MRKLNSSSAWWDYAGGDGGQVIVDQTDPHYVYGTYYFLSPFRFTDGMLGDLFTNELIVDGIDTNDRSAFYVPMAMDPQNTSWLFLGSYRVYRTNNRGDLWTAVSPDLTGCSSGRCVLSALGPGANAPALYVGSAQGRVYLTANAGSGSPTWTRVDGLPLPARPVTSFAVDRTNYRVAYVGYGGFNGATPSTPGHVFKTSDGGQSWVDVTGNLPDVPVNSLVLDPSFPNTLYAGTDVGPMVTTNGGSSWAPLGTGFPIVTVWQLDLNSVTRQLVAATHGRGVWRLDLSDVSAPVLQIGKVASSVPAGPGSLITYTLTITNAGNAVASGVTITDPVPTNTTFVSADAGGRLSGSDVVWDGLTISAGGNIVATFTVRVASSGAVSAGSVITNAGYLVSSASGASATGSPVAVTLVQLYAVSLAPSSYSDATRAGQVITYSATVRNVGSNFDNYSLTSSGNVWPTTFWDIGGDTPIMSTGSAAPGETARFVVRVSVPSSASNGAEDVATVSVTSMGNPSVSSSTTISTTAITRSVLLVDGDGDSPDVKSYYQAALDATGNSYNYWNLAANAMLPLSYLNAHSTIVWFTGSLWPGPITPHESSLAAFLDGGGRLFLSGMDILDQGAGTTSFVRSYLHVNWDGTERQNDIPTATVTAAAVNTVTGGMGTITLNAAAVGLSNYMNEITPMAPAAPAFLDARGQPNAITVTDGNYKVVFLAFPFEALGTASNRSDLMRRIIDYFRSSGPHKSYFPVLRK
ncbi:MAG: DUF11 domain-containing protein [Chloroflexi bacterium]|nr:DUF11 domain-containing protein [Chloroflexota bacterium]